MLQPDPSLCYDENEFLAEPLNSPISMELLQKDALHTLGENAAAVLHELRGPLQAVLAHVQLLERKTGLYEDTALARHFLPIYQGIDHISALLNQFLRLSRLTSARLTRLDIAACLQEIIPLLRSMAVMRDIEFTTEFDSLLPICFGDEQQLKRLVFNLFANACDAISKPSEQEQQEQVEHLKPLKQLKPAEQRRPKIQLILRRESGNILLSVCDNGCGISKEKQEKIWQPFYTDKPAGTGLGLPSCLAIASAHGGKLTVTSTIDEGSCFTLRLPICPPGADISHTTPR